VGDKPDVIIKAYEPEVQIMNSEFYKQVLERLMKHTLKVGSQF
jgi:hypothetical protein